MVQGFHHEQRMNVREQASDGAQHSSSVCLLWQTWVALVATMFACLSLEVLCELQDAMQGDL